MCVCVCVLQIIKVIILILVVAHARLISSLKHFIHLKHDFSMSFQLCEVIQPFCLTWLDIDHMPPELFGSIGSEDHAVYLSNWRVACHTQTPWRFSRPDV